jgi:hypothetical protein
VRRARRSTWASAATAGKTREAAAILKSLGVPLLIHQPSYSLLNRWIEEDLLDALADTGAGCIAFSPLAQGLLTDKYLAACPADARINRPGGGSLKSEHLSDANLAHVRALNEIARSRGQTLAQMAVAWVLRDARVTSALIGASRPEQIADLAGAMKRLEFSPRNSRRSTSTRSTAASTSGSSGSGSRFVVGSPRPAATLRFAPGQVRALADATGHPPLCEALRSLRSSGGATCAGLRTTPPHRRPAFLCIRRNGTPALARMCGGLGRRRGGASRREPMWRHRAGGCA